MRFVNTFSWVFLGHIIYSGYDNSFNYMSVLAFTALSPRKNNLNNNNNNSILFGTANERKGSSRSIATAVVSPPSSIKESRILKNNPSSSEECISKTTGLQPIKNNHQDSLQEDDSHVESVQNVNDMEEEDEGYDDELDEDTKSAAVKAALERQRKKLVLLGRNQRSRQKAIKKNIPSSSNNKQGADKAPPRRTLSAASRARSSTSMPSSTTLLKGIRTAAAAAAAASKRTNDLNDEKNNGGNSRIDNQKKSTGLSSMTKSVIQSTINYMLQTQSNTAANQRNEKQDIRSRPETSPHYDPFGVSQWYLEYDNTRKEKLNNNNNNSNNKQMGVLGEPVPRDSLPLAGRMENEQLSIRKKDLTTNFPGFGHVLIPPAEERKQESNEDYAQSNVVSSSDYSHQKLVRIATPKDDVVIANLRMSVFSGFNNEMRQKFCLKSCQVLHSRRMKGATCLVSTCRTTDSKNKEIVLGSAECSTHEFSDTEIGKRRIGGSVMYITEFAVHPKVRGSGTGTMLLQV